MEPDFWTQAASLVVELLDRATRLVFESGRPIAHVAADLGLPSETLRKYVRQVEADEGRRPDLPRSEEREEIRKLRVTRTQVAISDLVQDRHAKPTFDYPGLLLRPAQRQRRVSLHRRGKARRLLPDLPRQQLLLLSRRRIPARLFVLQRSCIVNRRGSWCL